MKHMNRILALALALLMVLGLATTAYAADNDKYEIFQIFTGDISNDKLVNVKWGQNGTNTPGEVVDKTILDELTAVNTPTSTDAEKLAVIEKYAELETVPYETGAADTYNLDNGYYLVRNVANSQEGEGQFYTLHVVKVVNGTLTIVPKGDAPEVEKDVDKTDINIGDTVTFTLTATMPSTFDGYESYKVVFHDTMYKGLTYNNDATVSVDGFTTTTGTDDDGNTTITITNEDVLVNDVETGDTITVTYTATLNAEAIIGTAGNPNKVKLEYSNNPNGEGYGETPEKEVKVYTWDMGVLKYADNDKTKVLEGVKFILLNADKTKIAKVANGELVSWDDFDDETVIADYELTTGADGKIAIAGLASGNYLLRETQELPGYNKLTADVAATVDGKTDGTYVTYVAEVNNQSGATLPETGGIGTTLFYVIGGLLVAAAVVLLIAKKRMASAE